MRAAAGAYRVYYGSRDRLDALAVDFDIWEVRPAEGAAVVALGPEDAARLQAQGYLLEPVAEEAWLWSFGPPGYPCYRDVADLYSLLAALAAQHPHLAHLVDYGDSWRKIHGGELGGYDLLVLEISSSLAPQPKPHLFLMADIHARELTTPEVAMHFVEYLLDGYGSDPDVTWILDYHQIDVVVTANPDGRQLVEQECQQRKNRNATRGNCTVCDLLGHSHFGVDLNRNNPYHWGGASLQPCFETYQGETAGSEPETYHLNQLVRELFADQRPADDLTPAPADTSGLLVSLHSYGNLVLWPWGWTDTPAPNGPAMQTLGRKLAFFNGYLPQQSHDLYRTTGDTTDWAYGELGIPAYTFEIGEFFFQSCADLQQIVDENLEALIYAAKIARAPYHMPAGPDAIDLAVAPAAVASGASVQLQATIDDTRYGKGSGAEPVQPIAAVVVTLDRPPWDKDGLPAPVVMAPVDGRFDEPVERAGVTLSTAGWSSGQHTLYVQAQDAADHWGAVSAIWIGIKAEAGYQVYLPLIDRGQMTIVPARRALALALRAGQRRAANPAQ